MHQAGVAVSGLGFPEDQSKRMRGELSLFQHFDLMPPFIQGSDSWMKFLLRSSIVIYVIVSVCDFRMPIHPSLYCRAGRRIAVWSERVLEIDSYVQREIQNSVSAGEHHGRISRSTNGRQLMHNQKKWQWVYRYVSSVIHQYLHLLGL